MMKVKFWCISGANIHSCRTEVVDVEEWGFSDTEWEGMTEDKKFKIAEEWANETLEIGFSEVD